MQQSATSQVLMGVHACFVYENTWDCCIKVYHMACWPIEGWFVKGKYKEK